MVNLGGKRGRADAFLDFFEEERIPFVDKNYRTQPLRILVGHSHGGLSTDYALTARPGLCAWHLALDASVHHQNHWLARKVTDAVALDPGLSKRFVTVEETYGWEDEQWAALVAGAVTDILEQRPDLVFLDIQMPGFEVLQAVAGEHMPAVVFVTAFDDYALRAFEFHALELARTGKADGLTALVGSLEKDRTSERIVARRGRRHVIVRAEETEWTDSLTPELHGEYEIRMRDGKLIKSSRAFNAEIRRLGRNWECWTNWD